MKFILTILFCCTSTISALAQVISDEGIVEETGKSIFSFNTEVPVPKRAALYSAILPGLGQVYNKQYWKLGIVVAGTAAAGYFIDYNNGEYQRFRNAYIARLNDPTELGEFPNYQAADLKTKQDQFRQYLEYTVVFTTVGYALNILDALVAANLRTFDISEDISLMPKPTYENKQLGLALVFNLK